MACRVVFQQKFVEAKKREAISMHFMRMLYKLNPRQHSTTEQTLNHEWILSFASETTGSSLPAGGLIASENFTSKAELIAPEAATGLAQFQLRRRDSSPRRTSPSELIAGEKSDEACGDGENDNASLAHVSQRLVLWTHASSGAPRTPSSNAAARSSR